MSNVQNNLVYWAPIHAGAPNSCERNVRSVELFPHCGESAGDGTAYIIIRDVPS